MHIKDKEPKNQSIASSMDQSSSSSLEPAANGAMSKWLNWLSFGSKCSPIPVTISILISTSCLCVMVYKYRKDRSKPRILRRSSTLGLLHGGKLAVRRLVDCQKALAKMDSLSEAEEQFRKLLDEEVPQFKELQSVAGKLEMSGKEDSAIAELKKAKREAEMKGKRHEAYELQMLIVEMLIYQGKHNEVLSTCECLNDKEISDARRPLYKAIIKILNGDIESARIDWKEFQDIRKDFTALYNDDERVNDVANNFDKFKEAVVKSLKTEIQKALDKKRKQKSFK